ncbi:hypothetical protein K439DRAFT_1624458 [Ramaria rubella]|nr:hypothetical protein K439DRAFT_1624678 [Ramaria rubella]KAF8574276.1 hypothetical protein K439DRAFT_1624458 [Ramaria rubella]
MHLRSLAAAAVFFRVLVFSASTTRTVLTIDNTSPQIVFSPTPCFQQPSAPDCTSQWLLTEAADAFNGSTTTTTGPDPSLGLSLLPRVSLSFQGSAVLFMPGLHSTAQASIVLDALPSVLVDTTSDAFLGTGLDPTVNHSIVVTFVPGSGDTSAGTSTSDETPTTLAVDYFQVTVPDTTSTFSIPSVLTPLPLPTSLPATTTPPTSVVPSQTPHHHTPISDTTSSTTKPTAGTIAAVSVSAAIFVILAVLAALYAARRRRGRKRRAVERERKILGEFRLPSEVGLGASAGMDADAGAGAGGIKGRVGGMSPGAGGRRARKPMSERGRWGGLGVGYEVEPWMPEEGVGPSALEKGKGAERPRSWRDSVLPSVHYIPWRR